MVKVITIRDEVYEQLRKLKDAKGMSFSEAIEYLLRIERERIRKRAELSALKGALAPSEIRRAMWRKLKGAKRW